MSPPLLLAIGLMSGTSCDGVDAALLRTDGRKIVEPGPALTLPYPLEFRAALRSVLGQPCHPALPNLAQQITDFHSEAVSALLQRAQKQPSEIGLIGFHGQTIFHDPAARFTLQIGDGRRLAATTHIDVIDDFRTEDVRAGGQGAPLVPLYHAALSAALPLPLAVLNVGGVANVTWIGGDPDEIGPEALLAFDTGPGNALIDDWIYRHTGAPHDEGGMLAAQGAVLADRLKIWLKHSYFDSRPPKSLDRNSFAAEGLEGASVADGAATLTAFTAASIAQAAQHFPHPVKAWLVTGGGRHNPVLMAALEAMLPVPVSPVESLGWDGDAMEAQAFAYLAVRASLRLPLSLPSTTGVPTPLTGGRYHRALEGGVLWQS